jgi:hypothetical protein
LHERPAVEIVGGFPGPAEENQAAQDANTTGNQGRGNQDDGTNQGEQFRQFSHGFMLQNKANPAHLEERDLPCSLVSLFITDFLSQKRLHLPQPLAKVPTPQANAEMIARDIG